MRSLRCRLPARIALSTVLASAGLGLAVPAGGAEAAGTGVNRCTIYKQPISLAGGASKRVRAYLVVHTTYATSTARIISIGRAVASQDSVTSSTTSTLVGILSDQTSALDDFAAVHPGGIA